MNDNWLQFTFLMGAILAVLSPVGCTMREQSLIAEAIRGGVNPAEARCAFQAVRDQGCAYIAARQIQESKEKR